MVSVLTKAFLKHAPCVLCYLGYLAIERKVAGLQKAYFQLFEKSLKNHCF